MSQYFTFVETIDPSRIIKIDSDLCYESYDMSVGRLNLTKRLDAKGEPIFTCFRLQEDHEGLPQVQLFCLNLNGFSNVKSLASVLPDLDHYLVYQPEAVVLWQYKCKPNPKAPGRFESAVSKMQTPTNIIY